MKNKPVIPLSVQAGVLKSTFQASNVYKLNDDFLIWYHVVTPSPLSNSYKIKLEYNRFKGVKVFVAKPQLMLAEGQSNLPHVYSTEKQHLCLYYPKYREWHPNLLIAKTIIPWACEWLFFYEIWLATGEWYGGGIHEERK